MWYIYNGILLGILLSHKKEQNFAIFSNMELESIMLNEISQAEIDKYYMISLLCRILKIQQTSKYNKKKADSPI